MSWGSSESAIVLIVGFSSNSVINQIQSNPIVRRIRVHILPWCTLEAHFPNPFVWVGACAISLKLVNMFVCYVDVRCIHALLDIVTFDLFRIAVINFLVFSSLYACCCLLAPQTTAGSPMSQPGRRDKSTFQLGITAPMVQLPPGSVSPKPQTPNTPYQFKGITGKQGSHQTQHGFNGWIVSSKTRQGHRRRITRSTLYVNPPLSLFACKWSHQY